MRGRLLHILVAVAVCAGCRPPFAQVELSVDDSALAGATMVEITLEGGESYRVDIGSYPKRITLTQSRSGNSRVHFAAYAGDVAVARASSVVPFRSVEATPVVVRLGAACDTADLGTSCLVDGERGACVDGECRASTCGDAVRDLGREECDDGNDIETDDCLSTCEVARCGDGFWNPDTEECDGSVPEGEVAYACVNCFLERCGDGITQSEAGEQCDDGNDSNADNCTNACALAACNDGFIQPGETCDSGRTVDGPIAADESCSFDCAKVERCGDGIVDTLETCDDANDNANDGCDACRQTSTSIEVFVGEALAGGEWASIAGLAMDLTGRVYIADPVAHRVTQYDPGSDSVYVVAGVGNCSYAGDDGPAPAAGLCSPSDVAVDNFGNVYIADSGNGRVRRVDRQSRVITTVVGGESRYIRVVPYAIPSTATSVGYESFQGLAVTPNGEELYYAASYLELYPGSTCSGFCSIPGFSTERSGIHHVDLTSNTLTVLTDEEGRENVRHAKYDPERQVIFYIDRDNALHQMTTAGASTPLWTAVTGGLVDGDFATATVGTLASLSLLPSGDLLVVDQGNAAIRQVTLAGAGAVTTVAGNGSVGAVGDDGPALDATFRAPASVVVSPSGAAFIGDSGNLLLREALVGDGWSMRGRVGGGVSPNALHTGTSNGFSDSVDALARTLAGTILYADASAIREFDPQTGYIRDVAGSGPGYVDGPAALARFGDTLDLAVTSDGAIWVADYENNYLRRIRPDRTLVETIAGDGNSDGAILGATAESISPVHVVADGESVVVAHGESFAGPLATNVVRFSPDGGGGWERTSIVSAPSHLQ